MYSIKINDLVSLSFLLPRYPRNCGVRNCCASKAPVSFYLLLLLLFSLWMAFSTCWKTKCGLWQRLWTRTRRRATRTRPQRQQLATATDPLQLQLKRRQLQLLATALRPPLLEEDKTRLPQTVAINFVQQKLKSFLWNIFSCKCNNNISGNNFLLPSVIKKAFFWHQS